jgi:hypothetical protein
MYAPKHENAQMAARYQSVRIIAAYDASQLGNVPGASR